MQNRYFSLPGNDKIAESLLKAGANVNAVDKDGWSPLFFAIVNGNLFRKANNNLFATKSF